MRLSSTILKQCGIGSKVEIEVRDNEIILKPIKSPREGWQDAFQQMNEFGDDGLIICVPCSFKQSCKSSKKNRNRFPAERF